MITLPKPAELHPKTQPHNFFIYGATMSGKSYFSSFFPKPLVLNTDGNSEQGSAPAIQIRNLRDTNGNPKQLVTQQIDDIIVALQNQNQRPEEDRFQTVVIDVIDDVCIMLEQAICLQENVQSLADVGYGKGYALFNAALQQFVMDLKALPLNVIYISREIRLVDDKTGAVSYKPSLKDRYYNIVNGNCDVVIRTKKFGDGQNANYFREVKSLRTMYKPENITNKRVLRLLASCTGMFTKEDLEKLHTTKNKENK